ncbi:hypothetical protein AALP_AA6G328700 [Arabis alpina]|uniref:Uncharacterized protein n=1 Tax=Arabis alpina TaxID=50452 RepID=A0A087GT83_ARAAL|nr:hypothetical protein AALP_AA6G328700 [Arabis alpina]
MNTVRKRTRRWSLMVDVNVMWKDVRLLLIRLGRPYTRDLPRLYSRQRIRASIITVGMDKDGYSMPQHPNAYYGGYPGGYSGYQQTPQAGQQPPQQQQVGFSY